MSLTAVHTIMLGLFVLGYAAIAFEHKLGINKAASAVGTAALLWGVLLGDGQLATERATDQLLEHLADTSQVIFFLLGAMTLVEVIDAHGAFRIVTDRVRTRRRRSVLVIVGLLTFFMSSVLDNLTTTIVMVSVLRRMVDHESDRLKLTSLVVIAANAGGAWTPIGDVTTTMLWIGGQVTTPGVVSALFIPSLASLFVAMALFAIPLRGEFPARATGTDSDEGRQRGARRVLSLGLCAFLLVPVLKATLHIPPFLGIGFGLSALWVLTDVMHREADNPTVQVPHALSRIDVAGAFFFLGILLAVGALQTAGILAELAVELDHIFHRPAALASVIGLASAVVDNVPLVAATMRMYPLSQYAVDQPFWDLIAYCAGTGGSILIIGSAAGVALMGMERVTFGSYIRTATPIALISYFAGLAVLVMTN